MSDQRNLRQNYAKQAMRQVENFENHLIAHHATHDKERLAELERMLDESMALLVAEIEEIERRGANKEMKWIRHEYERYKRSRSKEDYFALGEDLRTVKQQLREVL